MSQLRKYEKAWQAIQSAKSILVAVHYKPDGDAVSAASAIASIVEGLGKKCSLFSRDPIPENLYYLRHTERFEHDPNTLNFSQFDLVIIVDCGSIERSGLDKEIRKRQKNQLVIEFDHHPLVESYADIEIKESDAASSTEVIWRFIEHLHLPCPKDLATAILTGIMTDTGFLLYPSVSAKTIQISARLLSLGASYPKVLEKTWRNKGLAVLKLWGKAMANLEINPKYNTAFSFLSEEDLNDSAVDASELDGISGSLSNLHGIKALLFLYQDGDFIKGSLRSQDKRVNVSNLARALGGGGHAQASGFRFPGRIKNIDGRWQII